MSRLLAAAAALALALLVGSPAVGAQTAVLDQDRVVVEEGDPFRFVSTISNDGSETWSEVTVTLNVIRAGDGISEDPEDWDPSWSHRFVLVEPGRSVPVQWDIRTIKPGDFLMFATALVHGDDADGPWAGSVVATEVLHVHVDERPTIPTGRLMVAAVGVPALLGVAFLSRLSFTRSLFSKVRP